MGCGGAEPLVIYLALGYAGAGLVLGGFLLMSLLQLRRGR
jgi:hypothetical protein